MEVSPTLIAQSILTMGFSKGLWTPDIAEIIKPAIMTDITLIGSRAEVDINFGNAKEIHVDYNSMNKKDKKEAKEKATTESSTQAQQEIEEIQEMLSKKSGLMSKAGE